MRLNHVLLYFRKRASRRGLGISNKIATSCSTARPLAGHMARAHRAHLPLWQVQRVVRAPISKRPVNRLDISAYRTSFGCDPSIIVVVRIPNRLVNRPDISAYRTAFG
jgi:hypothetical protein